uniref:F-box/kelch-repeat protein n=1 Tax=Ananas comosus var. bracteatus TaxID=296719 RepID=A0A6V7NYJ7_ANACO|nr:unnamed protein product [Ananas comosus var. bracteatus]
MGSRVKAEAEAEAEEEEKFDSSRDPRVLYLGAAGSAPPSAAAPAAPPGSSSASTPHLHVRVRFLARHPPRLRPPLPHVAPPLPHVRGPPPPPHLPLPAPPRAPRRVPLRHGRRPRPFGATWRAVEAPRVWRVDPVVAATAGGHVAVIGGACQLALGEGEDAGAVEVRGPGGSDGWEPCDPIPAAFDGSKSATWLSAATSDSRVYITDKNRGWTSWFDLETKKWGPTRQLRPDPAAASFAIGILSSGYNNNNNNDDDRHRHRLVLATAGRREGRVEVRLWEADAETLDVVEGKCAAAEMPKEFAKRMFQDITEEESDEDDRSWGSSSLSVGLCSSGDGGYVYNGSDLRKGMVRFYDYYYYYHDEDGRTASCKWEWIGVPMIMQKEKVVDRVVVVGCTVVGLDDLALLFPY